MKTCEWILDIFDTVAVAMHQTLKFIFLMILRLLAAFGALNGFENS